MSIVKSLAYNGRFSVGGLIRQISQDQNETLSLKRKYCGYRKQKCLLSPTEELSQQISRLYLELYVPVFACMGEFLEL